MNARTSFLAVPIKARIGRDGRLISADPEIWRLHMLAGGDEGGVVSIPGLANLAALALRTRMRAEKSVRAVDEEGDVELWTEATPFDNEVQIIINGWREIGEPLLASVPQDELQRESASSDRLLIDPDLRIVEFPASLPIMAVGQHFGAIFVLESDNQGNLPLIDALSARKPVDGLEIGLVGTSARYRLDLQPVTGPEGTYIGHAGQISEVAIAIHPDPPAPMGRQFASVLKQPLSRIVANAETIGSKLHGPLRDNYAEYAQDIATAARHLTELVADMEDLEAIDRPDFSVAHDRIELGDLARRVAGLLALKASDHGIRIITPPENEKVQAIGEFRRVLQILLNLVGNAIRYAPDGSTVTIAIRRSEDRATITIADEGEGIVPENRERIFEKFERLGRSGDGGSGLGLYISRKLARAMDGELSVGAAPGGGALFSLELPAR
jgi:signal transduction histidine kinase